MSVAYVEEQGSPVEDYTYLKFTAQRRLRCAWADRITLMQELRGSTYSPWPAAICTHCHQDPVDGMNRGTGDASAYDYATIIADYETLTIDPYSTFTESIEPFSQFMLIDSTHFCFASALPVFMPCLFVASCIAWPVAAWRVRRAGRRGARAAKSS